MQDEITCYQAQKITLALILFEISRVRTVALKKTTAAYIDDGSMHIRLVYDSIDPILICQG